uniref:(northern house mosquito) hypothetical protein n=1 Tax=Culex pipiens TaxID=7175 RepID=A0A8D8G9B4_CULPI
MGTAWPQKYHSSRGHASAATVLALNKTASSPVVGVVVPPSLTLTLTLTPPPPVSRFRTEDDEPTVTTADAESAIAATATTATTVPSVGPAGGRERRRWWCRSAGNDRYPVPAAVPVAAGLWQLSPWRPTGAGEDLDDRGSIKAVAATPKSATAPTSTTTTKTTTTTMNASNHVTLNRFVRLTITLLITRTLMLRLVQLQMLLASAVVVLAATNSTVNRDDDNNKQPPHQQQQQPNAAIQQPTNNNHSCTVSRRRRSAPTTKTKGTGQRQPSDNCWPPSLYCYPVPAVVAILRTVIVANESVKLTAVVRIDAVTKETEAERGVLKARREGQHDHRALGCSEWCGCFCRHCSSLTCSRFFTENVTRRSCPGPGGRPTERSARRCSRTRRTTRASVCTSS